MHFQIAPLSQIVVNSANSKYSSVDGVLFNNDKSTIICFPCGKKGTYTIPDSVTSIGGKAFSGCTGLTSVSIPDSVTSIGYQAFSSCSVLTSVYIPDSVTNISSSVFFDCTSLTEIVVDSANSIYSSIDGVLFDKDKSTIVCFPSGKKSAYDIPDNVTSIGNEAFSGCTGLTSISIPDTVTSIGDEAFSGCTALTSISIPDTVTDIGNKTFSGCTALTSISIPDTVTDIGNKAFSGCTGLISFSIPDSVTSIGFQAFSGCTALTSVSIPDTVKSIGVNAFYLVPNIKYNGSLNVSGARTVNGYTDSQGLWYSDSEYTKLTACPSNVTGSISIPDSVTSIKNKAFIHCSSLTSISIPDNVTNIEDSAFYGCSSLASVSIPDSVTTIGFDAFYKVPHITYNGTAEGSPWGAKSIN